MQTIHNRKANFRAKISLEQACIALAHDSLTVDPMLQPRAVIIRLCE